MKTLKAEVQLSIHLALHLSPMGNSNGSISGQVYTGIYPGHFPSLWWFIAPELPRSDAESSSLTVFTGLSFHPFMHLSFDCNQCTFLAHTASCQQDISHLNCALHKEISFTRFETVTCWFHLILLNFCAFRNSDKLLFPPFSSWFCSYSLLCHLFRLKTRSI